MSFFSNLSTLFGTQTSSNKKPQLVKPTQQRQSPPPQPLKKVTAQPKKQPRSKTQPKPQAVSTSAAAKAAAAADVQAILNEAKARAREIIVEAKDESLEIRSETENKARETNLKLEKQQQSLDANLSRIEARLSSIEKKESNLDTQKQELEKFKQTLTKKEQEIITRLEQASSMTTAEAKKQLFEDLEKNLRKEMAQLIRQREEEAQQESESKVREIIIDSMRHGATDYVAEYTVSTVELPSEEVKGKIIGKSGRNIHAFEKKTGVDVDLDADPKSVRLSCFNPVRREIARISLEKLIKDGRIQPTRIEEIVDKVTNEIDKVTFEAGKKLCHDLGIYNLPNELMKLIGKFKYRFSYGQNLIAHTLEETRIGIKLAHELGIDVNIVKLGCLLHDIGKVSDEVEGSHVELGVKIAKKYDLPQAVIDCIAQHHEDEQFSGPEQIVVYIADAISGARPGARYENYEEYIQRLEKLEDIANQYPEVEDSYAIQAGREIRVILKPGQSKDDDVTVLANKIRDEIKDNVIYPGTVTVTVLRETRSRAIAK